MQHEGGDAMYQTKFPVIDLVATGENILRLRKQRDLSVRDLQKYFGFEEPQAIYKWQKGKSLPIQKTITPTKKASQSRSSNTSNGASRWESSLIKLSMFLACVSLAVFFSSSSAREEVRASYRLT